MQTDESKPILSARVQIDCAESILKLIDQAFPREDIDSLEELSRIAGTLANHTAYGEIDFVTLSEYAGYLIDMLKNEIDEWVTVETPKARHNLNMQIKEAKELLKKQAEAKE